MYNESYIKALFLPNRHSNLCKILSFPFIFQQKVSICLCCVKNLRFVLNFITLNFKMFTIYRFRFYFNIVSFKLFYFEKALSLKELTGGMNLVTKIPHFACLITSSAFECYFFVSIIVSNKSKS